MVECDIHSKNINFQDNIMPNNFNFNPDIHSAADHLGFDKYVKTLSGMIRDPNFKTPFCIGIYGKWGSGKTSFMYQLSESLLGDHTKPHVIPVWFNPWRYSKEEHLIIPFLKTIEQAINTYIKDHTNIGKKLLKVLEGAAIKMGAVAAAFAYGIKAEFKLGEFGVELDVAKMADREEAQAKERIEKAKKLSEKLSSIYYDIVKQLKEVVQEDSFRITVFIDDLDRCLPEKALELLEAIKLFLDMPGYLFVIGVAKEVVEKGIAYHYRYLDHEKGASDPSIITPEDYLDKMIQLPLELPPVESGRKRKYIESLLGGDERYKEHADLIEIAVGENPRALKRYVNLLAFMSRLADNLKEDVLKPESGEEEKHKELIEKYFIPLLYIKWSLIVFKFPRVNSDIKGNRQKLIELQNAATGKVEEAEEGEEKKKAIQIDDRLKKILQKGKMFPDDPWLIDRFVHLTESTKISVAEKEVAAGYTQTFQPGDMVKIPRGKFLYGEEKLEKEIDYDYFIDVFPVTNKQYKEFVESDGYEKDYYWSENGLKWRDEKRIKEPENWTDEIWNQPDNPVVGVSLYEVEAFCYWRSEKKGGIYRLPTDEEWEKAARGSDGREYPWGNEFDKNKCNTAESDILKTTPVTAYPKGASPHKCREMAGNVWELTDSWYDEDKDTKVIRGGSWDYDHVSVRCVIRDLITPEDRGIDVGFRCVRTKKA